MAQQVRKTGRQGNRRLTSTQVSDSPTSAATRAEPTLKERAIRTEVTKRVGDQYELTWVDKVLGLSEKEAMDKPWFYHAWTYPTARLMPAIGKGAKEAWDDFTTLFKTVETDIDPQTGHRRERSGTDLMVWQLERMLRNDLHRYFGGGKARHRGLLQNYQRMYQFFGPDAVATQEAGRLWSSQYREWERNSLFKGTLDDLMSRYGSSEALASTLYHRPDKILVDLADLYSPQLPQGVVMRLRRATPENWREVVDDVETELRQHASDRLRDVHPELLGADNTPKTLHHGSPEIETILEEGKFSKERLAGRTGAASAREGFFFTDNPAVARSYGVDEDMIGFDNQLQIDELIREKDEIGDWDEINMLKQDLEDDIADYKEQYEEPLRVQREAEDKLQALYQKYGNHDVWLDADIEAEIALRNKLDWVEEELNELDYQRSDLDAELQEAEENLQRLEDLDREIEYLEEELEHAIWEFGQLETVNVHLIMQNPMIFEMQQYNSSLADTMRQAKAEGYDGIIIKNMYDPYYPVDPNENYVGTHYIVFEPGQIVNAETGLPMGDITNVVTLFNVAAGRQTELSLFTPAGVDLPKQVRDAIEQNNKGNPHLSSFYAATLVHAPVKKVSGKDLTPSDIVLYLEDADNDYLVEQLNEIKNKYPQEFDNVLQKYKDLIPKEYAEKLGYQ